MLISKYEAFFSNWLFQNLPSSADWYMISNIDFIITNYHSKKFMMVELKTRGNEMKPRQRKFYNMIHKRLNNSNNLDNYTFVGSVLISFNWDTFNDWNVYMEGTGVDWKVWVDEQIVKHYFKTILN